MHDGQVDVDRSTLAALLADQHPALAALPLTEVDSHGTVNRIIRIGDALVARLPLVPTWAESLERELRWLDELAPHLPLRVPRPVAAGRPSAAYPLPWAILDWIDGDTYPSDGLGDDEADAAGALADFVLALRAIPLPADAPHVGRRPLAELDVPTRAALAASADLLAAAGLDADDAVAAWDDALAAPPWDGTRRWMHGDLLPGNVLVAPRLDGPGRAIAAVIDFGGIGAGDPAHDLTPAWTLFGDDGRRTYRAALAPHEGDWRRGRGIALHQAALIAPYYRESNPPFTAVALATIGRVLDDLR